ncbi:membrane protein insertion efficiency factor YidD [Ilumatobacter nonamiensis]|uniref:membrane protein insertion efficiency factor YidD n=1 Tax=Ilumatobacter nonamiensis TaxID=467093 RepID=UPI0003485668|nr:membrane protein insertion efficiency factor YidD [Ilumatobacter nonamiensis]
MTTTWVQRRALAAINWYQRLVEGRPSPCRFFPSCSTYASEAFAVHGTRRGAYLTLRRLLRCRPFGPSGFDPVPDATDATSSAAADPRPDAGARRTSPTTFEDC